MDEAHVAVIEELPIGIIGIDDDQAILVELEVALDQRQGPFADRSEADHHDRASDAPVPRPMGHQISFKDKRRRASSKGLKPWPSGRVNSARALVFVAKLSHQWARRGPASKCRRRHGAIDSLRSLCHCKDLRWSLASSSCARL